MTVTIAEEPPRQPPVQRLLALSDAYAASLYPAESNHMLDLTELEGPGARFFVARRDGSALGCAALVADGAGAAEIKRMFVDPAARGLGIGARLMECLEQAARGAGIGVIRLETGTRQPEAIGLYRRFGYAERPPFGAYRPDPLCLFMEKPLP